MTLPESTPEFFTISKEVQFDAGHRVPNHKSKCKNPHGHRYRVVCHVTGSLVEEAGSSDEGMVLDFGDLKAIMESAIHDRFDHGFIVYEYDHDLLACFENWMEDWKIILFPYVPTAENLAKYIIQLLTPVVANKMLGCWLSKVEVWETPTSCAEVSA